MYRVNEEYAGLYENQTQDSRDLNEPPSNIEGGLGCLAHSTVCRRRSRSCASSLQSTASGMITTRLSGSAGTQRRLASAS